MTKPKTYWQDMDVITEMESEIDVYVFVMYKKLRREEWGKRFKT
jgi:hypothetical protein